MKYLQTHKRVLNLFGVFVALFLFSPLVHAGSATLTWNANTESDLAGYTVYYGTSARTGTNPNVCGSCGYATSANVGAVTSYTFNNLAAGNTYYFSISAFDTTGNKSAFSSEVTKTISAEACTSFTYSAWSACQSNSTQSRTVTSSSPVGCTGGNPILSQSCSYTAPAFAGGNSGNVSVPAPVSSSTAGNVSSVTNVNAGVSSGLSNAQIQAILGLLSSFGADTGTIANVQAVLSGGGTTSSSGASGSFTRDLQLGMVGSDVQALQRYLNNYGYTVAVVGSGAPGNETTTFGPATRAALSRYQTAHGITPAAGYFGTKTRAIMNAK